MNFSDIKISIKQVIAVITIIISIVSTAVFYENKIAVIEERVCKLEVDAEEDSRLMYDILTGVNSIDTSLKIILDPKYKGMPKIELK